MGGLFGCEKSRLQKLNNQEEAIIKCKVTRDEIKKYIKILEKNEKLRKDKAKEALKSKDRDRAKMYLRQSNLYKEQINVANGQLTMLEDQIIQLESSVQMKNAIKVLEEGNKVLKQLNEEVNIEKWEKIADDMNEIKQQQDEIGNFLKSHSIDETEYNEAVDKELEALMNSESDNLEIEFPDYKNRNVQVIGENEEKEDSYKQETLRI
jgi:charged multivesicular body protein 6